MYSKQEASHLKQAFWTAFGQYIAPQLSAEGLKVNWVNYKTGIKYVQFRMQAGKTSASIAIEIAHADPGIRELYFEQFKELKSMFEAALNEQWDWQLHHSNEQGRTISRIRKQTDGVSIFSKNDWPALISFFKPRIISLDEFWNNAKYAFETLK